MADAKTVFEYLHQNAGNFEDVVKQFNDLDKAGQAKFLNDASKQFGLDATSAPQRESAVAAVAAGDPNAKFIPDVDGQNAPFTPGKDAAREALSPVTKSLPIAGGMIGGAMGAAAGGIGAVPGTFAGATVGKGLQIAAENLLGDEASPKSKLGIAASITGEGVAQAAGAKVIPKVMSGAGYVASEVAQGLKSLAKAAGAGTMRVGGRVLSAAGAPWAAKIGNILADEAAIVQPEVLKKGLSETGAALLQTGKSLERAYGEVGKFVPPQLKPNAGEVKSIILEGLNEADTLKVSRALREVMGKNVLENSPESVRFGTLRLWEYMKEAGRLSGKYKQVSNVSPAAGSRAEAMSMIQGRFKEYLMKMAGAAEENGADGTLIENIKQLSESYHLVGKAQTIIKQQLRPTIRAEAKQAGLDRAAKVLGLGPKVLGEASYKRLMRRVPAGLSSVALEHSKMLMSDEDYAKRIEDALK